MQHPPFRQKCNQFHLLQINLLVCLNLGCAYDASNLVASIGGVSHNPVHYTLWSTNRNFGHRRRELPGAIRSNRKCSIDTCSSMQKDVCLSFARPHQFKIDLFCFPHFSWLSKYSSWLRQACLAYIIASCQMQHIIVR